MIVRLVRDRILLIAQPDHAHVARTIMESCVPLAARPRRDAILHAIGEHDNGWAEEDAAPIVDPETGSVGDFARLPPPLAFCTASPDAQRFGAWTVQPSGTRIVVTPDVFGGATIPIEINAREIRRHTFRSDADLRHALSEANTTTLRGEVAGH